MLAIFSFNTDQFARRWKILMLTLLTFAALC